MRILFLFTILLIPLFHFSQNDTLNGVDNKRRKQGYWKIYLDSASRETDSSAASYIAYTFYNRGKTVYYFINEKWRARDSCVFIGRVPEKGKPIPANGSFVWYNRDKMLSMEMRYENGMLMRYKEIHYSRLKGSAEWGYMYIADMTRRYRNIPGTYLIVEQHNQAVYNIEEFNNSYYRKGPRGWKKYRIKTARVKG